MADLRHVTFAVDDPDALAEFWAAALDGEIEDLPDDAVIVERSGEGPDLLFKRMPCGSREELAIHLDLSVADREAAVAELCDLGATVRETKSTEYDGGVNRWTVMDDPAGNGFCVSEY